MSMVFNRGLIALWGGGLLLALALPLVFKSGFLISLLCQMGIMVVFALSYNMLLGHTGLLSFGHAVYYGLGAFATMHTLNAVGQIDTMVKANIPTYAVFIDPMTGNRTCTAYNATGTPRWVTFSNGALLYVAPRTLGSTSVGGCKAAGPLQFLPMILR